LGNFQGDDDDAKEKRKIRVFAQSEIFKHLSLEEIKELASYATTIQIERGEILFRDGEKSDFFYIVQKGLLKLFKGSSLGKNITFSISANSDTLNAAALSVDSYFMTAQAINDVTVLRIGREDFLTFANSHPSVAMAIIAILARRISKEYQKIVDIIGEETEQRLLHSLFALASRFGPVLMLKREELADFCGMTTETTIRVLSKLKKKGIISDTSNRGKIVISDMTKLQILSHNL
jgi:CRP-like cAMP-binding protein